MRLAALLETEGFEQQLHQEMRRLDDPSAFSSHAWLWLICQARSKNIELRSNLMEALFTQSSSVFVRTAILDIAVSARDDAFNWDVTDVREFPNAFLAAVMTAAVQQREQQGFARQDTERSRGDAPRSERLPSTTAAEVTLVSLLQAGRPITLSAASTLLRHRWDGRRQVNTFFWTLADGQDEETRREWLSRVRAQRPESGF
jgi:hypothetical protein